MKASLFALPLSLALGLAAPSAFADGGTINFNGKLTAGSCAVEIIDPGSGGVNNQVALGEVKTSDFKASGSTAAERRFQMRLDPATCTSAGDDPTVSVTFTSAWGPGENFALNPSSNTATGIAVAIKNAKGVLVKNGVPETGYVLDKTKPTLLTFLAMYIRTDDPIKAGTATADVEFTVTIT